MDGIDGLASSVILVSLISIVFFSYINGNSKNLDIVYFLIISIIAFLFFNLSFFSLKKIFLGDSGSTLLGFIAGFLLIYFTNPDSRNFHPILAAWSVALPIYDLLVVILRRIYRQTNPFKPDRRHFHHLLAEHNFSNLQVLIIIIFSCSLLSIIGGLTFLFFGPLYSSAFFIICFIIYLMISIRIISSL